MSAPPFTRLRPRVQARSYWPLVTFWRSWTSAEACVPNRGNPPMSIEPVSGRPGTKTGSGCDVLASTVCPIRVRLYPNRAVCTVAFVSTLRYSTVVN